MEREMYVNIRCSECDFKRELRAFTTEFFEQLKKEGDIFMKHNKDTHDCKAYSISDFRHGRVETET